jgi:hypothetical protein
LRVNEETGHHGMWLKGCAFFTAGNNWKTIR